MCRGVRQLRIFIASPGDCQAEREIARRLVAEDPTIKALQRDLDVSVEVYGWEGVVPDIGRPQSLINAAIEKYNPDWFIFIFWHRFGIDAGKGMTGTEEEWTVARQQYEQGKGHPHISLYFNKVNPPPLEADASQMDSLHSFKESIFKQHEALAGHFEGPKDFENTFRSHLAKRIIDFSPKIPPPAGYLRDQLLTAATGLLNWPTTLGTGDHIEQPELLTLIERIRDSESSSTIILGSPGTGKSALLANLANHLVKERVSFLAIKADMIGSDVDSFEELRKWLNLTVTPQDAIRTIATSEKVVLLVDQLDAVSELLDRKSGRLNVLLNLIHSLARTPRVHIVTSSREFEFRHDVRLTSINAERIDLNVPNLEQIAPILSRAGHDPERMGDSLRDLLRVPLHLKLFLEVAVPGAEFESLQALLEELWNKRVVNPEGPDSRLTLLEQLAERMADEETLWLSAAVADTFPAARQALEQAEILARGPKGLTIGFRHQTYYDHTLARAFARGSLALSEYVLERQDGLFIRPTFLSGLNYLRATSRPVYHRQLKHFLDSNLRLHLRMLLIEFLGELKDPDDYEAQLVLPLLSSEREAPRVLHSIANSQGWFVRLKIEPVFHEWLSALPEKAAHCEPILSSAARFAAKDMLELVETFWTGNAALSLSVLLELNDWNERAVNIATRLVRRAEWWQSELLAEKIAESLPDQAPRIIRAEFDRQLENAVKECEKPIPPVAPDADEQQRIMHELISERFGPVRRLIQDRQEQYDLEEFAKKAPKAFLHHLWPWFLDVISRIANEEHEFLFGYRRDPTSYRSFEGVLEPAVIVQGLLAAVIELATKDKDSFLEFLNENVGADLMIVHRLLARGLESIVSQQPQTVLNYLLSDPRRLMIGDMHDNHRETKRLIKAVCPHLSQEGIQKLEEALRSYGRHKRILPEWSAKERLDRKKWEREERLGLLRALDENHLSAEMKKLRAEEELVFPRIDEFRGDVYGGLVGPRLTAAEMARASDEDLLQLFGKLPDSSEWDNPKLKWSRDLSRAGGAIQLAREFGELAKQNPTRVATLISRLQPKLHERYAGEALQGLASTDFPAVNVISLIEEIDKRGFSSGGLREDVASALERIASRNKGLPDAILHRLEEWIAEEEQPVWPPSTESEKIEEDNEKDRSILYSDAIGAGLSLGRGSIIRAIAKGYLQRDPPDIANWARVIQSRLPYEKHPDIWAETLTHMPILFRGGREMATVIFDAVVEVCPHALRHPFALHAIAPVLRSLEPKEKGEEWLDKLLADGSGFCRQAYGELLPLFHCSHQDSRSRSRILDHLAGPREPDIDRGLAYAAANLWDTPRCQEIATQILCSLASCEDSMVQRAVAEHFRLRRDTFLLNQNMRIIIESVRSNPRLLLLAAEDLVGAIEPLTGTEPEFVSRVCNDILRFGGEKIGKPGGSWIFVSEAMTSIALTFHRQEAYREVGLELFEQLISLNVREARAALEVLDRKPTRATRHLYRPRRRRRRRNIQK